MPTKEATTWWERLVDTTQDAVITADGRGNIVLFNASAERIFGWTADEVVGRPLTVLMAQPYAAEHDEYVRRYEETGHRRAIGRIRTVRARRKNGQDFPIELSVTELDPEGAIRYAAVIRDISEKVDLQSQLLEHERLAAIGTMAAKFAHEVGNPLNSVYMHAQLLQRRIDKQRDILDERIPIGLDMLMGEISRLNALLREFRSLSRREQFDFRPLDLNDLVTELCRAQGLYLQAAKVDLEESLSDALPPVRADGDKVKQVLLNLCKNATEAMPEGGRLEVRTSQSDDHLALIEVKDTGGGIQPGVNVFEPFVTTKEEGTGLGLAISRQIAAAHGGHLSYESTPGEGTTFALSLPLFREE